MNQVVERYAKGLFELALECNKIESWQQEVQSLIAIFEQIPHCTSFFTSTQIEKEDKKQLIHSTLEGKIDPLILNFFYLLVDKKRMGRVTEILVSFNSLCNQHRNILEGNIFSARMLTQSQILELEEACSKQKGSKVQLRNKIDPRLISGVRIVLGNEVIDSSMKARLSAMKQQLLKESR